MDKQEKVNRVTKISDAWDLKEKLVVSGLETLGSATVTATATSNPSYGLLLSKEFLVGKTTEMNEALDETTYYGTSDQITSDLRSGTTTRVIQYVIA